MRADPPSSLIRAASCFVITIPSGHTSHTSTPSQLLTSGSSEAYAAEAGVSPGARTNRSVLSGFLEGSISISTSLHPDGVF